MANGTNGTGWKLFEGTIGFILTLALVWVGVVNSDVKANTKEIDQRKAAVDAIPKIIDDVDDTRDRVIRIEEGQKRNDDAHDSLSEQQKLILKELRDIKAVR